MAGFRNVVPPLGVYSGAPPAADGGFDSPIPAIRISGDTAVAGQLGGFGTPLGVLLVRSAGGIQGGFDTPVPMIRLSADGTTTVEISRKRRTSLLMMTHRNRR